MKEYIVTFEVSSPSLSLHELSDLLGMPGSPYSYSIGSAQEGSSPLRQRVRNCTTWRLESDLEGRAEIEEHLQSIADKLPSINLDRASLPDDVSLTLDIAVMFDTVTCTVRVPARWLQVFSQYAVSLATSCYPTDFGDRPQSDT